MLEGIFRHLRRPHRGKEQSQGTSERLRVRLHGRASFPFEVVETLRFQNELRSIMGVTPANDAARRCIAVLRVERSADKRQKKVGVRIDGSLIGYMPDYLSAQFQTWLKAWKLAHAQLHCLALIEADEAGRGARQSGYRVKLDIEIPFKMTTMSPLP